VSFHVPERNRIRKGKRGTDESYGNNGMFLFQAGLRRPYLLCTIASDGSDWAISGLEFPAWEHVSVSTQVRCPTWEEMCFIKGIFWDADDVVMQFHPRESEYVNQHPFCLHMWRPIGVEFPTPPSSTVGDKVLVAA
jgi:hypothetical protein